MSGVEREDTRQTTSPSTSKVSRLVVNTRRCEHESRSVSARWATESARCSQLSRTNSVAFLCRASVSVSMSGRPGCSRTLIARVTA